VSTALKIADYAGKCTFDIVKSDDLTFFEGATIAIIYNLQKFFKGFVFTKKRSNTSDKISVTCYNALRYLKNKDTKVFEGKTSSQIFAQLCDEFVLPYKIVDPSSHVCTPRSEDTVEAYKMIKNSLDDTLVKSSKWFFIRDNFGVLEHINVLSMISSYVIGDASGLTNYEYQSSIDNNVYNQIKLYRDNKSTGKRDIYIVNDTINGGANIKAWGILQYYAKVDEYVNSAQIPNLAAAYLRYFNNVKRDISVVSESVPEIQAGSIFRCNISDLGDISLDKYLLVTECTHEFYNNSCLMKLSTEVTDLAG
jgi:hypothetical protein